MISGEMLNQMYDTMASCQPTTCAKDNYPCAKYQEGEKPMCYTNSPKSSFPTTTSVNLGVAALAQPTVEMTQRDFFSDRIRQETQRLQREVLRPQFFMDTDDEPKNYLEMIERVKADDYTIDDEAAANVKKNPKGYYGFTYGIRWGKNKPDHDGFEVAVKALKQAAQDVIDEATLSPTDKLLALLQNFRNWTFTAKAEKAKK